VVDPVSLFSVRCYLTHHNLVNFVKEEKNVQAVLKRLDRLTQDEARITAAQTLEVIHGLVHNMKVVMDGLHATFLYFDLY
jgi:hypothetical protein